MKKVGPYEDVELKKVNNRPVNTDSLNLNGKITSYLIFCLATAVIGSGYVYGLYISVWNTPFTVMKAFFYECNLRRTGKLMEDSTFETLWSITNALMPLGGIFTAIASGYLIDRFGRKTTMLATNVLVIIAGFLNIISYFVYSYETIMISRFFVGLFSGLFTGALPVYLSEVSPVNHRGSIGTLTVLSIVVGILVNNILGLPELLGTRTLWVWMVGLMVVPSLAHIGLFFAVESPKHLYINKKDIEQAKNVLLKLRGGDFELVNNELLELNNEKIRLENQRKISYSEFYRNPVLRRGLIVSVVVHMAQQFSGINAVILYSTKIFISIGLEGNWPLYGTVILGAVQLIMLIVCMFLVDRLGRRVLLISGTFLMGLFSFLLAIFRITGGEGKDALNYMTLVSSIGYILFYAIGLGPLPWIISTEVFDLDARGKANSISIFSNWFSNFIVTIAFPYVEQAITNYSFIVFGVILLAVGVFLVLFLPETKNRPIEKIIKDFEKGMLVIGRKNELILEN